MPDHYVLFYDTVDDHITRRAPFREEHLRLAKQHADAGSLVMAGALADPPDGAVLVFRSDGPEVAEDFARNDPYVKNGLIRQWRVRKWTVVVGGK